MIAISKVEEIFRKMLGEKNYSNIFGYVCFFGSLNLKHDLDVFIIPREGIKKGEFLKILTIFLENIRVQLRKEKISTTVLTYSVFEEEVEYISLKKQHLKIHISSFADIQPEPIKDMLPFIKKPAIVLLGKFKQLNKITPTAFDYYFNYLFYSNCLLSNYPTALERTKIYNRINHIYKCVTQKKKNLKGSPKNVYFECCDFLDSVAY